MSSAFSDMVSPHDDETKWRSLAHSTEGRSPGLMILAAEYAIHPENDSPGQDHSLNEPNVLTPGIIDRWPKKLTLPLPEGAGYDVWQGQATIVEIAARSCYRHQQGLVGA